MLTARTKQRQLGVAYKNAAPPAGAQLGRPDCPLDVATAVRRYMACELRAGRDLRGVVRDDVRATIEHALTGHTSVCTNCGECEGERSDVLVTEAHGREWRASLCLTCEASFDGKAYLERRAWVPDVCGWL